MAVAPARRIGSGLVLLCAGFAPVASAQRASLMAHASVTDVRVTARATRQLQFGALPRGATVTIDSRNSSSAGLLKLDAMEGTEFSVAFQLPTRLEGADESTLPIRFGADAVCHEVRNGTSECQYVESSATVRSPGRIGDDAPPSAIVVRLGGTIAPPATQRPGIYEAVATASVNFTAN